MLLRDERILLSELRHQLETLNKVILKLQVLGDAQRQLALLTAAKAALLSPAA
jgi:hypothetical protein